MASCPDCGRRDPLRLLPRGFRATGPAHVPGAQAKAAALQQGTLLCDPDAGGCGWSVDGTVQGGYLTPFSVTPPPEGA